MLGGILLLLVLLVIAADHRLTVRIYSVFTRCVSREIRLAVISDLHSCTYGEGQKELLETVKAQIPDAVFYTGDLVDDRLPEENAWLVLKDLAETYPCYYVTGNHEYRSGKVEKIKQNISSLGIRVLGSDCAELSIKENSLSIHGVDDPVSGQFSDQLERAGNACSEGKLDILLSHRPERINRYLEYGLTGCFPGTHTEGNGVFRGCSMDCLLPIRGYFRSMPEGGMNLIRLP